MYVARDGDGTLNFFLRRPRRFRDNLAVWIDDWGINFEVDPMHNKSNEFEDLRWEDEPLEVKLVPEN